MKTYDDEIAAAREFSARTPMPTVSDAQRLGWSHEAKARHAWSSTHRGFHNALNVVLFAMLLGADAAICWLGPATQRTFGFWGSAVVIGLAHGWLLYHFTSVSLHEGAGHNRLIIGSTLAARMLRLLLNNVCRLGFADPAYYRTRHPSHHSQLGTEHDGAFTHMVRPGRVLKSFLPFAGVLPFADYRIHAGGPYTRSRATTDVLSVAWLATPLVLAAMTLGWVWAIVVFVVVAPWVAFSCDRLRETVDHALMPTDRPDAARSLGLGLWGWLLAPGPWGQCSHLVHHLFPGLPWYQQALLHRRVVRELTQLQHTQLVLGSLPALLFRIARETRRSFRAVRRENTSELGRPLMTVLAAGFIMGCLAIAVVPAGLFAHAVFEASWRLTLLPLAWLLFGFTLSLECIAARWLLMPSMRVGEFSQNSSEVLRWGIVHRLTHFNQSLFVSAFRGTPVINWWFRALGAQLGRNVVINSSALTDWSLLRIDDDTVIGFGVGIQGHSAEHGFVRFRSVHIGANVLLGRGATVFDGTTLDDGVSLAPGSVVLPGKRLRAGAPWAGVPARQHRLKARRKSRRSRHPTSSNCPGGGE